MSGRAPFRVSMFQFVNRFCFSDRRREILEGFCSLRKAYYKAGIRVGFQWVNGSFSENIKEKPGDIDVVTFFENPYGSQQELEIALFSCGVHMRDRKGTKDKFHCDAFYMDMTLQFGHNFVERTAYWYGLFSHTRDSIWKGMVQLDLPGTLQTLIHDRVVLKCAGGDHE